MAKKRRRKRKPRIFRLVVFLLACICVIRVFLYSVQLLTSVFVPSSSEPLPILVNARTELSSAYETEMVTLDNGQQVSTVCYEDLQEMFDQMRMDGYQPEVRSGYRSRQSQQEVFDSSVQKYINQGYSQQAAVEETEKTVSRPGYSEHETGLSVDIGAASKDFNEDYQVYGWLAANAHSYGFILRYPENKEDITFVSYEPWHYRYVGRQTAQEIYTQNITLEEYIRNHS